MMKSCRMVLLVLCSAVCLCLGDTSSQLSEIRSRGVRYLLACQEANGGWMSVFKHPAMTAMAALGIYDTPEYKSDPKVRAQMDKALDFVVSFANEDGSIFKNHGGKGDGGKGKGGRGGYVVYNTSICLLALATYNRPQDLPVIKKARGYLMSGDALLERDEGGFGYGRKTRADLNNTAWAMDALYLTDYLDREPFNQDAAAAKKADLAWDQALQFVTICQNLKDTNQSAWVASAPQQDRGGFIYCPQNAMKTHADPRALRSYGTVTYAGLKSLIYAKVKLDDVRVQSALEWVLKNYTLDENPGVGKSGLFYYYHTFSKTLALLKRETVTDSSGKVHDWKAELVAKLASLQRPDGSWSNEWSGRWMESIPQLSTAYVLMALQNLK